MGLRLTFPWYPHHSKMALGTSDTKMLLTSARSSRDTLSNNNDIYLPSLVIETPLYFMSQRSWMVYKLCREMESKQNKLEELKSGK